MPQSAPPPAPQSPPSGGKFPPASSFLPDDASPEQVEKVNELERKLQGLLDEQAAGVHELIEKTVELHRRIKTEVAQMLEQDKEEEALVREVCIRTEHAEVELMRNPSYQAFREKRNKKGGVTDAQRLADWVHDAGLTQHVSWLQMTSFSPEETTALIQGTFGRESSVGDAALQRIVGLAREHDLVYLKVCGLPLDDIFSTTADDARLVLGCAAGLIKGLRGCKDQAPVSTEEIQTVHELLRAVHAHLPAGGAGAAALRKSTMLRKAAQVASTQAEPLCVAAVPLNGLVRLLPLRVLVLKGTPRAIEPKHPLLKHPALRCVDRCCCGADRCQLPALKAAVESFSRSVLAAASSLQGRTFVADLLVDPHTLAVKIDWVSPLTADTSRCVDWSVLCSLANAPESELQWSAAQLPTVEVEAEEKHNAIWSSLLREEQDKLRPGQCVWEGTAADGVLAAVTGPSLYAAAAAPPEQRREPAAAAAHSPRIDPVMCSAAIAVGGFAVGFMAARGR